MEDPYNILIRIENDTIFYKPNIPHGLMSDTSLISSHAEQVSSFLEEYGIVPTFIDSNRVYGAYDEVNGNWTGMIGHVNHIFTKYIKLLIMLYRLIQIKLEWLLASLGSP